jgi:hypothetical protein
VAVGVEANDLALVLNVVVDVAFAVGHRELRLAGQFDGGDHLIVARVDDADAVSTAVEGPHGLRCGIEDGAVRMIADRNGLLDGVGFAVELRDLIRAAVSDVSIFAVARKDDAVRAVQAGNVGDLLALAGVHDHDVVAAGNVEQLRLRINGEVVPSSIAAQFPFVLDVPGSLGA